MRERTLDVPYEYEVLKMEGPTDGTGKALLALKGGGWAAVMLLEPAPPYFAMDKYIGDYTYKSMILDEAVAMFNALCGRAADYPVDF